jgi:hypothetical protein
LSLFICCIAISKYQIGEMEILKVYLVVTMRFLFFTLVASTTIFDSPPRSQHPANLNFGMLPKGPVPPSGPSGGFYDSPPPPANLNFGILPKGSVPPSGPSAGFYDTPPPTHLNFGMLPKGPVPPSGPSGGFYDPPPLSHRL